MSGWRRSEEWKRRSETFVVEVAHWSVESSESFEESGPERWCVYAYIYPSHPLFAEFDGDSFFQKAAASLPLHGGCSFLHRHIDRDGSVASVQVGCDYNHLGDERFTRLTTFDGSEVEFDAEALFEHLKKAVTP